jgi:flavin reductase (DIM6/NTAB) family NADH-FMN oxidoreductase RutF
VTVSHELFRKAWGQFPTGVSVITSRRNDGQFYCTTANAISSVSLDPFLVLVSIAKGGNTYQHLKREGYFGINLLREDQTEMAKLFAGPGSDSQRAIPAGHHVRSTGTALLDDALAAMDCHMVQEHDAGDHTLFIAEVQHLEVKSGSPLVFFEGRYTSLTS